ncbi:MAG TPA: hypothetical protein VMW63_05255 [Methanoregulaceae archaeon]|nr:hypothetical protein [Methanoregulaceae archaeon]
MDLNTAVKSYQFAERAKSELIICSHLSNALTGFPEAERAGGKRMLILLMEAIRSEIEFAYNDTKRNEFRKSINLLSEAISLAESENYGTAVVKLSESISAATTAAQGAWQVLGEHGIL